MERTISGMMGKGSVNHNTRAFSAKNVDKERSRDNVEFCHKDIKAVYHELFDEALERYNAKQKRSDRKIDNYYEKIRQGKQEKLFHEVIFQIGNKDDMNVRSEEGQLAKQILSDFMADFQSRNPNLHVFSAHLHMDEETPHIHIDFVPVITGSKRGLDTRVSLKGALAAQGFEGGTRGATEWNQWIESEKKELAAVMERYGVEWLQKGTHKKHLSVLDYEKQERAKEVAELDSQLAQSERALQTASKMVDNQFARVEELAEMGDKFQRRNEEIKADNAELEKTYVDTKQSYNSLLAKNSQLIFENEDLELEKERRLSGNRELEKQQQKLQKELEAMISQRSDVYFDEQIWERVQNIYNYCMDKENLEGSFYYIDDGEPSTQGLSSMKLDSRGENGENSLAYLDTLRDNISQAILNKELNFVSSCWVDEASRTVKVGITEMKEEYIQRLKEFENMGPALDIFQQDLPVDE